MKRTIIVALVMSLLLAVFPVSLALAQTSQDVLVTATPSFTSITNAPDNWPIGTVSQGETKNTGIDYFTITNDSSVNMSISINCTGWTGGWTYGAPAADSGNLTASSGNSTGGGSGGAGLYDISVPAGPGALLIKAVPPGVNPNWELQLNAPTSFTFGDQQQTTVTITAAPE